VVGGRCVSPPAAERRGVVREGVVGEGVVGEGVVDRQGGADARLVGQDQLLQSRHQLEVRRRTRLAADRQSQHPRHHVTQLHQLQHSNAKRKQWRIQWGESAPASLSVRPPAVLWPLLV